MRGTTWSRPLLVVAGLLLLAAGSCTSESDVPAGHYHQGGAVGGGGQGGDSGGGKGGVGGGPVGGQAAGGHGAAGGSLDQVLRLHHVQVRGTHNSYHVEPAIPVDPSHEYSHAPLDEQLEQQGVRSLELDLHRSLSGEYEVYHIAVIDAETTCQLLADCLTLVKGWSDTHPMHLPIMIWFEIKDQTGGLRINDLEPIEDIIRAMFPDTQLLVPDDVRAGHESLREALMFQGWPTLAQVRGRVMFMVLSGGSYLDAYTYGYTSLAGRAMFIRAEPSDFDAPWAAVAKINNPAAEADIMAAHAARILVASNICSAGATDAECVAKLDAGKANGVHMLMDDFPAQVPERDYWLDLPDGQPARCNEQTAPPECSSAALEDL